MKTTLYKTRLYTYLLFFRLSHRLLVLLANISKSENIKKRVITVGIMVLVISTAMISCSKKNEPKVQGSMKKPIEGKTGAISKTIDRLALLNFLALFSDKSMIRAQNTDILIESDITNRPDSTYIIKCYVPYEPDTDF